jgi:hypothetical protein
MRTAKVNRETRTRRMRMDREERRVASEWKTEWESIKNMIYMRQQREP